ncbi:MAG: hypothetical protein ACTSPB_09560 [Candidatus Thorarchaeota archaeon]
MKFNITIAGTNERRMFIVTIKMEEDDGIPTELASAYTKTQDSPVPEPFLVFSF